MLTKKQRELLLFIDERISTDEISPSFDEMKDALGLKSKSGIHRLINALEERGFLRRLPHRARALEVIKRPEDMARPRPRSFQPSVIEGGRAESGRNIEPSNRNMTSIGTVREIPHVSKIAAGLPILASDDTGDTKVVPSFLLPSVGDFYALTVEGDSMIGAGINNGDTVIVQRSETARSGEIVVAYIHERNEATLKTLRTRSGKIVLRAENPDFEMQEQEFNPNQISIQGKLAALMRTY